MTNTDKTRVYELAKEMGYSAKSFLDMLQKMGVHASSNFSVLEDPTVKRIRETIKAKPGSPAAQAAAASVPEDKPAQPREIRRAPDGASTMVTTIDANAAAQIGMARSVTGPKPKVGGEIRRIIPASRVEAAKVQPPTAPPAAPSPSAPSAAVSPTVAPPARPVATPAPRPGEVRPAASAPVPPPQPVRPTTPPPAAPVQRPGVVAPPPARPVGSVPQARPSVQPGVGSAPPARPVSVPGATAPPPRPQGVPSAPPPRPQGEPGAGAPPPRPRVPTPVGRPPMQPPVEPPRPAYGQRGPGGPPQRGGRPEASRTQERPFDRSGRRGRPMPGGRGPSAPPIPVAAPVVLRELELPDHISVTELAGKLEISPAEIIKTLMSQGMLVNINQSITFDKAKGIALSHGFDAHLTEEHEEVSQEREDEATLVTRPPVVTVLGHVDHGKTSLLDAIRKTNVTAGEAGGITQRIGAYTIEHNHRAITFIDTPGHEAFTAMRARGAKVTDVAVLVVAADDGVMPQTIEAINHAKAAGVPIVVAVNKIDKPGAQPDRVLQQLTEYDLVAEDWGGSTICQPVSAKKGTGIDDLLEMILLVADMRELKANPNRKAEGTIIEAQLDKGLGPVATVLVQTGTIKVNDAVVCGAAWGKVRGLINDRGERIRKAGPAIPAEIIGLNGVPNAGDRLQVVDDEKVARTIAEARAQRERDRGIGTATARTTLDDFFSKMQAGEVKELNLVLKADGQGSLEALKASLLRLSTDEVRVQTMHGGVGTITESDVLLANASGAIIIGFNVRPDPSVKKLAEKEGVDIRSYRVIYDVLEDIKAALKGMLSPEFHEVSLGRVEVRQVIKVSKIGSVAGCYVTEGKVVRGADIRLLRDGVVVHEGKIETLRRFKDDAREVQAGFECGLTIEKYSAIEEGDVLEVYKMEERPRE